MQPMTKNGNKSSFGVTLNLLQLIGHNYQIAQRIKQLGLHTVNSCVI
jgi:hypothetical protein